MKNYYGDGKNFVFKIAGKITAVIAKPNRRLVIFKNSPKIFPALLNNVPTLNEMTYHLFKQYA